MSWSDSVSLVIRFIAVPYGYTLAIPNTALFNVLPLLPPIAVALLAREIRHRALGFFAMGLGATVVYVASMALVVRLTA